MKHKEWLGNRELIEMLLRQAGIYDLRGAGETKIIMKHIIWGRYVDMMTEEEIKAKLSLEYNINLSRSRYYRAFNKALDLMEQNRHKSETNYDV